jgi:hypothetical protein
MRSIADFLVNANFCMLLFTIDAELRDAIQAEGCKQPGCLGAKLDQGNYRRKFDATAVGSPESFELAFSLCCRDCRKQTRVPSVRFAGRCRTALPLFLLSSIFLLAWTSKRVAKLKSTLKVTYSTLLRWRRWFEADFLKTRAAQKARSLLPMLFGGSISRWVRENLNKKKLESHRTGILKLFAELNQELFRISDALSECVKERETLSQKV